MPIVFVASTQSNFGDVYLNEIEEERIALQDLFTKGGRIKQFIHLSYPRITIEKLKDQIAACKRDLLIFHFSGHADVNHLYFYDNPGNAGGLSNLLGQCHRIKLVFLNGCDTYEHVKLYREYNIPAVIATSRKVKDKEARAFAEEFYRALLDQHMTLKDAFLYASAWTLNNMDSYLSGEKIVTMRKPGSFQDDEDATGFDDIYCRLFVNENYRSILDWKITHGYNLPDLPIDRYKQEVVSVQFPTKDDEKKELIRTGVYIKSDMVITYLGNNDDVSHIHEKLKVTVINFTGDRKTIGKINNKKNSFALIKVDEGFGDYGAPPLDWFTSVPSKHFEHSTVIVTPAQIINVKPLNTFDNLCFRAEIPVLVPTDQILGAPVIDQNQLRVYGIVTAVTDTDFMVTSINKIYRQYSYFQLVRNYGGSKEDRKKQSISNYLDNLLIKNPEALKINDISKEMNKVIMNHAYATTIRLESLEIRIDDFVESLLTILDPGRASTFLETRNHFLETFIIYLRDRDRELIRGSNFASKILLAYLYLWNIWKHKSVKEVEDSISALSEGLSKVFNIPVPGVGATRAVRDKAIQFIEEVRFEKITQESARILKSFFFLTYDIDVKYIEDKQARKLFGFENEDFNIEDLIDVIEESKQKLKLEELFTKYHNDKMPDWNNLNEEGNLFFHAVATALMQDKLKDAHQIIFEER